tara:strand:+ start:1117 stop:1515 length:399 start_codon:yes stop_codon:yes gene_type:complete
MTGGMNTDPTIRLRFTSPTAIPSGSAVELDIPIEVVRFRKLRRSPPASVPPAPPAPPARMTLREQAEQAARVEAFVAALPRGEPMMNVEIEAHANAACVTVTKKALSMALRAAGWVPGRTANGRGWLPPQEV